jgi:hypothetical protein
MSGAAKVLKHSPDPDHKATYLGDCIMAASNSSRSRGIHVDELPWGLYARGTRAALVQHGITRDGPFPGDPGERKTICKTTDQLGREIVIRRSSKTTFAVCRHWSDEEKGLLERRRKREQQIQSARKEVASWPESAGDYRGRIQRYAALTMDGLGRWLYDGYLGGYRFDDAALGRLYEISQELLELVESGGIVLDPELRKKWTPGCIADASVLDATCIGGNVIPFRQVRDR